MRRRCAAAQCTTILCKGNPGDYCFAHEPEDDLDYCGYRFYICRVCGDMKELRHDYRRPAPKDSVCAVCQREGETRVTLLSDDNFNARVQSTILLQFAYGP